jgi:hypothetical protein
VRVTSECDTINSVNICARPDAQFGPALAYDGTNYLVAWADRRYTGTYWWATVARVTPQGVVLDTGTIAGNGDAHNEFYPAVAYDGNRCLVVWYHSYYGPYGVFGRFVNHAAQPEDSVIMIAPALTHLNNFPRVGSSRSNYLIAWADLREGAGDYDVRGQLVSLGGEILGGAITIATGEANQTRPDVVFDGRQYLVVWAEPAGIRGQWISLDGALVGPELAISDTGRSGYDCPRLGAGSANCLVVWSAVQGAYSDIYGNLVSLPGIEDAKAEPAYHREAGRTLISSGPLQFPAGERVEIFDCTGKRVDPRRLGTGLYIIRAGGRITKLLRL